MRKKTAPPRHDQAWDLVDFLTEFARLLLAAGISIDQFSKIAQLAFFQAASDDARFRNSRINQSAVAAMTGLNRTKIRALLKHSKKSFETTESRIDKVVAAWVSEAEFLTSSGAPRRLRMFGKRGSFSSLASKYGGDIPPRALLRELGRRRLVGIKSNYVMLTADARSNREAKRLGQVASALASVLRLPEKSIASRAVKVSTFEISHVVPTAVGRMVLQRRIAKSLKAFMADIEAACAAVALEVPARDANDLRKAKTSVLLMTQD